MHTSTTTSSTLQAYLGEQLSREAQLQGLDQESLSQSTGLGRTTISKVFGGKIVKLGHYATVAEALGQDSEILIKAYDDQSVAPDPPEDDDQRPRAMKHNKLERPTLITVACRKGGTGKTTTSVSVAACLARKGYSVLVVDLDGQGNSTYWLTSPENQPSHTIVDVFMSETDIDEMVVPSSVEDVWVLGANNKVDGLEAAMMSNPDPALFWKMADRLGNVSVDFVIFDCPADFDLRVKGALMASRWVLIPVETSAMGIQGLHEFIKRVNEYQQPRYNPNLELLGLFLVRSDNTIVNRDCVNFLRETYPEHSLPDHSIRARVRYRECYSYREPITAYDKESARDYVKLTRALLERMDLPCK